MSLTSSLISAVSGLQTSQRQMQITSGNVSNANVEGYSRKTASAITNVTAGQNSGVDLGQVKRQVNEYLNTEVRRAGTELSELTAKSEFMTRLTQMFGTLGNDSTLSNGLNDLASTFETLSVDPESATSRIDVVEAADEVARQLNRFSTETNNLRVEADRQIDQAIDDVNSALGRIAELNDEISRGLALDQPVGELRDERDRQLTTLTQLMDVRSFERSTGEMVVVGRTSDGAARTLVDSKAVQFNFDPSTGLDATATGDMPSLASDPTVELGVSAGGKLGALIEMRDTTLTDFHEDLDRLTQVVRDTVNAAHNQGTFGNAGAATITGATDVSGDTFSGAGATGSINISYVDANGEVTGSVNVSIAGDASPADIVASINGAGAANASINADGQLELALPGGAPAGSTGLTLDTNDAEIPSNDLGATRGLSHYFGLNNLFETPAVDQSVTTGTHDNAGAAGAIRVRQDIMADPDLLARGVPSTTVGEVAIAPGDNRVALQLAEVFEEGLDVTRTDNLADVTTTLSGFAADILSYHASRTDRAEREMGFQEKLHSELKFRADSESGVNIDEEMTNLVVFEQAYNASARVISTVQEMFDTLDRMMN